MLTYNFMAQFAPLVESGEKDCTIRAKGKRRPPKPGEALRFYTGMRTTKCRWIGDAVCKRVREIVITRSSVLIDGIPASDAWTRTLIDRDGHRSMEDFRHFFVSGYRSYFLGNLIEWDRATLNTKSKNK